MRHFSRENHVANDSRLERHLLLRWSSYSFAMAYFTLPRRAAPAHWPGRRRYYLSLAMPVSKIDLKQILLPGHEARKVVAQKRQDRVGHRLQLACQVVMVVDGRALRFQRFRPRHRDDIADPAAVLVLQRPALRQVVGVGRARRAHVGRHIALVIAEGTAQALAIDQ